jgi:hypothetical protein
MVSVPVPLVAGRSWPRCLEATRQPILSDRGGNPGPSQASRQVKLGKNRLWPKRTTVIHRSMIMLTLRDQRNLSNDKHCPTANCAACMEAKLSQMGLWCKGAFWRAAAE